MDDAARAEIVKQMQDLLYRDAPYLVTAYSSIGEAFRSDRFACLQPQPDPGGIWLVQYGVQNYLNVRPTAEPGTATVWRTPSVPSTRRPAGPPAPAAVTTTAEGRAR